jgi:hypothetical protein
MKCGSTTLYRDLLGHPDIYLPDKELNFLATADAEASQYSRYFHSAPRTSICGDVSTTYSMLPDQPGVAERAARILGRSTKIIYLVREPVDRAISHHRHMNAWHGPGRMGPDINLAVHKFPSIVNYSRYAMQLRPWRAEFGDDAISVVIFEDYIADRRGTMERLLVFLGATPDSRYVHTDRVFNNSDTKTVLSPFWLTIRRSPLYRRVVRPLMSPDFRETLRGTVLPNAPQPPDPPSEETVHYLIENARDDELELRGFLKRHTPIWDFDAVRAEFVDSVACSAI